MAKNKHQVQSPCVSCPHGTFGQKTPKTMPGSNYGSSKKPVIQHNPDEYKDKAFRWTISKSLIDKTHNDYGWHKLTIDKMWKILDKLSDYESWSWRKLESSSNGTNCGVMAWKSLNNKAVVKQIEKFFTDKHIDDEHLYKIETTGKERIWGVRRESVFFAIWKDSDHMFHVVPKKHT